MWLFKFDLLLLRVLLKETIKSSICEYKQKGIMAKLKIHESTSLKWNIYVDWFVYCFFEYILLNKLKAKISRKPRDKKILSCVRWKL